MGSPLFSEANGFKAAIKGERAFYPLLLLALVPHVNLRGMGTEENRLRKAIGRWLWRKIVKNGDGGKRKKKG